MSEELNKRESLVDRLDGLLQDDFFSSEWNKYVHELNTYKVRGMGEEDVDAMLRGRIPAVYGRGGPVYLSY